MILQYSDVVFCLQSAGGTESVGVFSNQQTGHYHTIMHTSILPLHLVCFQLAFLNQREINQDEMHAYATID